MKYISIKRIISPFLSILFLVSAVLLYAQQDPVISTVCPYIKEGKDLDKIIDILNQDLKNRPKNHDVRLYLGIAYFKNGEKEQAFKQLKKMAEEVERIIGSDRFFGDTRSFIDQRMQRRDKGVLSRDNVGLFYFTYGFFLKLKGEVKQAEKRFKAAIKADYEEADARFQLLDLYLETKNYKAANKELNYLEKLDQEEEKILFLKGYLHNQDKKLAEAQSCFEKALSLKPDFLLAKKNLALLQYNAGNYQKAIEMWREIIQNHPDDKDAHINLGRAYFHTGETEKAKEEFKTAGLAIDVDKYSPKKVSLLSLQLTRAVEFKLTCGK